MPEPWSSISSGLISHQNVVILAGGVGGARMADGFAQQLPLANLTVVVNTGDDFEHLGLTICPDLDTVCYMLAGLANPATGWGLRDDSWRAIEQVARLGGPAWFRLGDLDLATHLVRTHLLKQGERLTAVTRHLCAQWGVQPSVLPMSDDRRLPSSLPTRVCCRSSTGLWSGSGSRPYGRCCCPTTCRLRGRHRCSGESRRGRPRPVKPFVSLDPILNVYPIRAMIMDVPEVVVAVSLLSAARRSDRPPRCSRKEGFRYHRRP